MRGIAEGIRFARSRPELTGTYLVGIDAMLFGMPNALFRASARPAGRIELVSCSSGPTLGGVEAGAVAAMTGPRFPVGIGGGSCVAGTRALAAAPPAFRRYDGRAIRPAGR